MKASIRATSVRPAPVRSANSRANSTSGKLTKPTFSSTRKAPSMVFSPRASLVSRSSSRQQASSFSSRRCMADVHENHGPNVTHVPPPNMPPKRGELVSKKEKELNIKAHNKQQKKIAPRIAKLVKYITRPVTPQNDPEEIIITSRVDVEGGPYKLGLHREATTRTDRMAQAIVKALRKPSDWVFKTRFGHRAIVLETVAAVPGMVAGVFRHFKSLRRMDHDNGWIKELLDEAENERRHLLTFIDLYKPTYPERILVALLQVGWATLYATLYLFSPRLCHRITGYLEEEAIYSYTKFLNAIDAGTEPNVIVPDSARKYWKLAEGATLRDLVLVIRADEARHRDVNHRLADAIQLGSEPDLEETARGRIVDQVPHLEEQPIPTSWPPAKSAPTAQITPQQ